MSRAAAEIAARKSARTARLSDAALLDVFMLRRKTCVAAGYSLSAANAQAHGAVDEAQESLLRVALPRNPQ